MVIWIIFIVHRPVFPSLKAVLSAMMVLLIWTLHYVVSSHSYSPLPALYCGHWYCVKHTSRTLWCHRSMIPRSISQSSPKHAMTSLKLIFKCYIEICRFLNYLGTSSIYISYDVLTYTYFIGKSDWYEDKLLTKTVT